MVMIGKYTKLILSIGMMIMVLSCEKQDEIHKITIEDKLIHSFQDSNPELKKIVAEIIVEAKALNYRDSLNALALLAATNRLNESQKLAINNIVKQLRYDMEEEIFSERERQKSEVKAPEPDTKND